MGIVTGENWKWYQVMKGIIVAPGNFDYLHNHVRPSAKWMVMLWQLELPENSG